MLVGIFPLQENAPCKDGGASSPQVVTPPKKRAYGRQSEACPRADFQFALKLTWAQRGACHRAALCADPLGLSLPYKLLRLLLADGRHNARSGLGNGGTNRRHQRAKNSDVVARRMDDNHRKRKTLEALLVFKIAVDRDQKIELGCSKS